MARRWCVHTHINHTNLTQNEVHIRRQRHQERPDEHAVPGPGPPQRAHAELPERRDVPTLAPTAAPARLIWAYPFESHWAPFGPN